MTGRVLAWLIDVVLCPLTGHGLGSDWWYEHVCRRWERWAGIE